MVRSGGWVPALCGFALALALWWPRSAPVAVAGLPPPPVQPVQPPAAASATAAVVGNTASAAPAPGGAAAPARVWDLCGLGRIPVPPGLPASSTTFGDLPDLPAPLGTDALAAVRVRTLAALQAGPPAARAAAILLRPVFTPPGTGPAADAAGWADVEQLAALGRSSGDPAALQWAYEACSRADEPPACRTAAARVWVQGQPDNAVAWALLAESEPAAGDAAWQGLLQAARWDVQWGRLSAVVLAAVPADVPAYLRMALLIETQGVDAAVSIPAPLPPQCRAAAGAALAPQRRSECGRVAELLVGHSDNMLAFAVGVRMGESAGWPADRMAALRAELQVLLQPDIDPMVDAAQPLSCASVNRLLAGVAAVGRLGELGAKRERLQGGRK